MPRRLPTPASAIISDRDIDSSRVLFADFDDSLLAIDSSHKGILRVVIRDPLVAPMLPVWLIRGRAVLKKEVAIMPIVCLAAAYGCCMVLGRCRRSTVESNNSLTAAST